MTNSNISIQERTKKFAVRVIKAYVQINQNNHFNNAAAVLSKQFLRSGTSIGANCAEGKSLFKVKSQISKVKSKNWSKIVMWEISNQIKLLTFDLILLTLSEAIILVGVFNPILKISLCQEIYSHDTLYLHNCWWQNAVVERVSAGF